MIGTNLKRFLPDKRYVVSDFESEGLSLYFSRPWQLAWLIADSKRVYEERDYYIWFADLKVSPQAALITGFNYAEYKERARPPLEVLNLYEERLYDTSLDVIGQNFFYDGYIHNTLRRVCGKPPDWSWMKRMIDTNAISKALRKGWIPDIEKFLAWQWKTTSCHERLKTKLGTMCQEFGIEYSDIYAHDALYDVQKTRELYEALKWKMEF